nr:tail fiber assembly protein [Arsenophonus endosymbiont of Bemisia tabaci]
MYFTCKDGLGWLAESLKDEYIKNNNWDSTAKPIPYSVYHEFALSEAPLGKMFNESEDGDPIWVDIPPRPNNKLIADAENEKRVLMQDATDVIIPLQDAVDLEMATEDEIT